MNTLQKALQEYLAMRRALGFQLLDAGPALSDFVSFLKRRRTSHITIRLALEWAQKPGAQPARWAHRLGFVRGFARYRSATDPRTEIPPLETFAISGSMMFCNRNEEMMGEMPPKSG